MKTIHFNTKRRYTVHGQRITAILVDDMVTFKDHDRLIIGQFKCSFPELFDRAYVMERYDAGAYEYPTTDTRGLLDWKE